MDQQPNFDFIMNPQKNKGSDPTNGKKQRIMVVVGGTLLLLVITIILANVLSAASGKANNQIVDLAAYQTELKRVIGLGQEKARSSTTKNKAVTASYALESDYQQTVTMMKNRGISPPKDFAARYAGTQSDTALDAADKANAFDEKYEEIYKEKLGNYKAKLAEIYPSLTQSEQVLIKKSSDNTKILLGEPVTVPATTQ
jgi:hypothetical protein